MELSLEQLNLIARYWAGGQQVLRLEAEDTEHRNLGGSFRYRDEI